MEKMKEKALVNHCGPYKGCVVSILSVSLGQDSSFFLYFGGSHNRLLKPHILVRKKEK
jgi:hypothetical protein